MSATKKRDILVAVEGCTNLMRLCWRKSATAQEVSGREHNT